MNLRVFSPNKSCAPLRNIPIRNKILLRLGSTTPLISKYKYLELNTIEGVKISANKILMKKAFDNAKVKHSEWINSSSKDIIRDFLSKHKIIIAKHKHSSQGKNIYYIDNKDLLEKLFSEVDISNFIFEKYYFFPNEYRVHIDKTYGLFYACKKVLKEEAEVQWHKHADNSIFVLVRENSKIPECWQLIIEQCISALKEMNLHIACFDILCSNNDFIIVESNTAPSLGVYGLTYYSNHIRKYYENRF